MVGTIGRIIVLTAVMAAALSLYAEEWTEASVKALSKEEYEQKRLELAKAECRAYMASSDFFRESEKMKAELEGTSLEVQIKRAERSLTSLSLRRAAAQADLELSTFNQLRNPTEKGAKRVAVMQDWVKSLDRCKPSWERGLELLKKKRAAESQ